MITYETYCQIKALQQQGLRVTQIAHALHIHKKTVERWVQADSYRQRTSVRRPSKLDPYRHLIAKWLELHPYSCIQILHRLREVGYVGGVSIIKSFVGKIRPRTVKAFLTLSFEPGECAQVDWGTYGTVKVGSTERRLSFFVMVLCYSRQMYVEFTVSETMEHFLICHQNAFNFFGAVPRAIMVDNLKSAVIKRMVGEAPVFNRRYLEFANHYGFTIRACGVGKGNEKGRVENAVGYIKKNFLAGLEIPDFRVVNPAARSWLDDIANMRVHGTTHAKPIELFQSERAALHALPVRPYDCSVTRTVRVTNRFRIKVDGNTYSVPSRYAGSQLTLKAHADRLCAYHNANLVADHIRSYDRYQDFEHPDHPGELLRARHSAREQRLIRQFYALSPQAETYYQELVTRRMNPRHHIRQIVALSEVYGADKVARALEDTFTYQAFSCEYVANLLEQRARFAPQPGALHVPRRQDLLEISLPEPNLAIYSTTNDSRGETAHEIQR